MTALINTEMDSSCPRAPTLWVGVSGHDQDLDNFGKNFYDGCSSSFWAIQPLCTASPTSSGTQFGNANLFSKAS